MMNFCKVLFVAAMTNFLSLQQAFCMPIENVSVRVCDISGNTSGILISKMSSSMQVVADQILLDKDTENISKAADAYQKLFTDIGNRVLTGYDVKNTNITVGYNTDITINIAPWSETINNVEIDLQFSGIDSQTARHLEKLIPTLRNNLYTTIKGASVDAEEWADGILRRMVREEIEQSLPEFKAAVDLVQKDNKTIVQVIIYPVGQVISHISYEMRSESIPNILLNKLKGKYKIECEKLRGVPVSYLKKNLKSYETYLTNMLLNENEFKQYNLKPEIKIIPGSDTVIDFNIYSDDYKIWIEGYTDIGRDKDNISGKAHLGKYISDKDEIFTEAELVLDDVNWNIGLGYTRYWGKSVWSYQYKMPEREHDYKLEYNLSNKWRLRAEHFAEDNRNEYGARYRIHEFLSAEYVYGGDEFYLRLIGNL